METAKDKESNADVEKKEESRIDAVQDKAGKDDAGEKEISDKTMVWGIFFIVLVLAAFFSVRYFTAKPRVYTIEELNTLNIEGKLDPDEGYLYNGAYSFVKLGGLWYTQLKSPSGRVEFNIPFHFGPRDVEDLNIKGNLNEVFTESEEIYITFNPLGQQHQYTALAIGEFDQAVLTSFGKKPVAACDRNETEACLGRPIVTCDNKDKAVVYFKEAEKTEILFDGNCVEIKGSGTEIVRAVDRVLLYWYGIVE